MSELKAGCLALVISSGNENEVGKAVTLIRSVASGEFHQFPNGNSYAMKTSTGQSMWVVSGEVSIYTAKPSGGMSIFPARSLMPIDGDDFDHEDERQRELTHG